MRKTMLQQSTDVTDTAFATLTGKVGHLRAHGVADDAANGKRNGDQQRAKWQNGFRGGQVKDKHEDDEHGAKQHRHGGQRDGARDCA